MMRNLTIGIKNEAINNMEYLNQFHKEAVERKMQIIKDSKKLPMDPEKEAKRHFEMHERIKRNYPTGLDIPKMRLVDGEMEAHYLKRTTEDGTTETEIESGIAPSGEADSPTDAGSPSGQDGSNEDGAGSSPTQKGASGEK